MPRPLLLLALCLPACFCAEQFDPAKPMGTLKGVASWLGEIPEQKILGPYPVSWADVWKCRAGMAPLLSEDIVVSPNRKVANLVVFVSKGYERFSFGDFKLPPALSYCVALQFKPHVLPLMTGQSLRLRNDDFVSNNWHLDALENPQGNVSLLDRYKVLDLSPFKNAELGMRIKSDLFGWMHAYICVFDHPFFAVTKYDGKFELHLPPGDYEISFWHEQQGHSGKARKGFWIDLPKPIRVSVTANETTELNCVVKDGGHLEPPASRVEFDPTQPLGVVKGAATFAGDIPIMPLIAPPAVYAQNIAAARQNMPDLRKEELVVNPDHRVANVVAYVSKGHERFAFDAFKLPPAISTNKGLQFVPHVLAVKTGQRVQIANQDPLMINWHLLTAHYPSENPEWNLAVNGTETRAYEKLFFNKFELGLRIQCDIYQWMRVHLCIFEHPFFAVTKEGGTFELHLPPGDYEISFWHEGGNDTVPAPQRVLVNANKTTQIDCIIRSREQKPAPKP